MTFLRSLADLLHPGRRVNRMNSHYADLRQLAPQKREYKRRPPARANKPTPLAKA